MEKQFYLAFKQAGIIKRDAEKIMKQLSKETLYRILQNEFDRRLILPVLKEADSLMENVHAKEDTETMDLDTAVNQILNNKKKMFVLMKVYCLEK